MITRGAHVGHGGTCRLKCSVVRWLVADQADWLAGVDEPLGLSKQGEDAGESVRSATERRPTRHILHLAKQRR
jgi:hypothetical protein